MLNEIDYRKKYEELTSFVTTALEQMGNLYNTVNKQLGLLVNENAFLTRENKGLCDRCDELEKLAKKDV